MNTTILALDLGTHTGWALQHLDGTITSGTEHFKPQRFEGGGMRFLRFKRWLNELLSASSHINAVFFEEVRRHAGVDAAHAYGGFMGHLAKTDDISEANMRRAIVFGSVMASFNVQDFGVKRVARLTWPEVVERYRQFQGFTRFDDCDA